MYGLTYRDGVQILCNRRVRLEKYLGLAYIYLYIRVEDAGVVMGKINPIPNRIPYPYNLFPHLRVRNAVSTIDRNV